MKSVFQSNFFSTQTTLNLRGRLLDLTSPQVMGILNVTPDSFFDGGRYTTEDQIQLQAEKMITEGAGLLDIGGYSTRPGADDISEEEERKRVTLAIRTILKFFPDALLSVDTFRSTVAEAAIEEGAVMINDVSGGSLDSTMFETVARLQVPYILMHMRGTPQTMIHQTAYNSLLKDITDFFHERIALLQSYGIKDIVIDPGFGFAKNVEQNFELLHNLDHFNVLGKPLLAGLSRKSMIWRTLSLEPDDALNGTTALNTVALLKGASILRVHDVKEAVQVVKLVKRLG